MINIEQFRTLIIEPVLSKLQVYTKDAEELMVFTCAAESLGGTYLHQVKGSALGIYQMEPPTYTDIWINFILNRNSIATLMSMNFACPKIPDPSRLIYDLHFATAMTRIHYMRVPMKIPSKDNIEGIWEYYKKFYNTNKGKAKKDEAIEKYKKFAGL